MWNKINKQKKKKNTQTNKQIIIQLTTITLVIYHRQQHFVTTSHRDRSPCAQISSNIEDHSPSWSRGRGMKRCISSSLSLSLLNMLEIGCISWVYIDFSKCENIYYSNFQILQFILWQPILYYIAMILFPY